MWPFRKKAITGTAEVVQAMSTGWNPLPQLGGGSRQRIVEAFQTAKTANYSWLYARSPAVRSVIDTVVRNVGQLDLRLFEEIDDAERQPKYDHPAALSLRYPSETVPADQFIRTLFRDYLTSADAVAIMLPAANGRLIFKWVPISRVQFLGSNMFDTETYRINDHLHGTFTDFPAAQILHWRGEHPDDPRLGLSHLETLRGIIAEDVAMQQANVELANSGMAEPTWVYRPGDAPEWSNEARKGFEEDLTNRVKRRNRVPVVLEEGMELRPFGVSPKDAEALDLRKWIKGQVADEYGVPRGMVGLADNIEEARSAFVRDTLPPYCEEFTKMLNLRILVRVYNWTDGCFEFNLDEKHMGDDRLKALVSATGRPVLLTNEGRARLNLPPIDGGDELVTPLNVTVGEKPSVDVMPIQDPNKPPQDGSYREEPKALGSADHVRVLGPNGDVTWEGRLTKAEEPLPQLHPRWKAEHDRQLRHIDEFQTVTAKHFDRLGRALPEKAGLKANGRRDRENWRRWDEEFASDILSTLKAIVEREGGLYAFKLGGEFDPDEVQNYLTVMAEESAKAINGKVRQEIHDLGLEGAIARFPAHTESAGAGLGTNATSFARKEAARMSPDPDRRVKTWVPNTKRHAQFGGQTVSLGDDWPAGFAPGSAPGCKCSMSIS
jgi:HK97 family phage portal protein